MVRSFWLARAGVKVLRLIPKRVGYTESTLGMGILGLALAVDLKAHHESKRRPSKLVHCI
jgi:hypothetical protein